MVRSRSEQVLIVALSLALVLLAGFIYVRISAGSD